MAATPFCCIKSSTDWTISCMYVVQQINTLQTMIVSFLLYPMVAAIIKCLNFCFLHGCIGFKLVYSILQVICIKYQKGSVNSVFQERRYLQRYEIMHILKTAYFYLFMSSLDLPIIHIKFIQFSFFTFCSMSFHRISLRRMHMYVHKKVIF